MLKNENEIEYQKVTNERLRMFTVQHEITWDLGTLLSTMQIEQHEAIQKSHEISRNNYQSESEFQKALKTSVLKKVEFFLLRMENEEVDLFKKIIQEKQYKFDLNDFVRADNLMASGLIFLVMDNHLPYALVPDEVVEVYGQINQEAFLVQKKKIDLIYAYAVASVNLYGVISLQQLTEIFNEHNDKTTTSEEIKSILTHYATETPVGLLDGDYFKPEHFITHEDGTAELLAQQKGKPRYVPEKTVFLKNTNPEYFQTTSEIQKLENFLKKVINRPEELENLMKELQFALKIDLDVKEITKIFDCYEFASSFKEEQVSTLLLNAGRTTRRWEHLGYSLADLEK
ncbi:MAG: hypothetical protein R3Y63_10230 [Eubacteriales bacterium]